MKWTTGLSLALSLAPALAIPPEDFGFPSAPNHTELTTTYTYNGNATVVQEGQLFGVGITARQPALALNTNGFQSLAEYNGLYVVMMVDPDARYPQNPTLRFILHWMQANMSQTENGGQGGRTLTNTSAPVVPYNGPAPPTNSSAHRYILYAFQQPENFSIPTAYTGVSGTNRTSFNLTDFISQTNLGIAAAAQYYFASNETGVPQDFIALAGGSFPGGNGEAVTSGAGPSFTPSPVVTSTASTSGSGSGSSTTGSATGGSSGSSSSSSAGAVPMVTGIGGMIGAGLLGLAAML